MNMLLRVQAWMIDILGRALWSTPATWDEPPLDSEPLHANQFVKHSTLPSRGTMGVIRDPTDVVVSANLVPFFVPRAEPTNQRWKRVGHG